MKPIAPSSEFVEIMTRLSALRNEMRELAAWADTVRSNVPVVTAARAALNCYEVEAMSRDVRKRLERLSK